MYIIYILFKVSIHPVFTKAATLLYKKISLFLQTILPYTAIAQIHYMYLCIKKQNILYYSHKNIYRSDSSRFDFQFRSQTIIYCVLCTANVLDVFAAASFVVEEEAVEKTI